MRELALTLAYWLLLAPVALVIVLILPFLAVAVMCAIAAFRVDDIREVHRVRRISARYDELDRKSRIGGAA